MGRLRTFKNTAKDFLGLGGILLFYFVIFVLPVYVETVGVIHSIHKHSDEDGMQAVYIPPWAWYRSFEIWWHDDYANVDWDKRLSSDMELCLLFLRSNTIKETDQASLIQQLEEFSLKIRDYPSDKKEILERGVKAYLEYYTSLMADINNSIDQGFKTNNFDFKFSSKTIELSSNLEKYGIPQTSKDNENFTKTINTQYKAFFNGIQLEKKEEAKKQWAEIFDPIQSNMLISHDKTLKKIFGKNLIELQKHKQP